MFCPKADVVCTGEVVDDGNSPDDWVLLKVKPEPNVAFDPSAEEPKIDDEVVKEVVFDGPKGD